MNLYGIYKRNTIDDIPEMNALLDDTREYWVTRDDIHKRLTGESEV